MMLATYSLWRRDVVRFLRQPSRIVGALLTPVIFWFVIGSGMGSSFSPGGFLPYYFPGSLALIVLFTAIFSTISIIEDRQEGFLQGVLASPAPRLAIVLGKALGSTTLAVLNGVLFLLLIPFSGLTPGFGDLLAAVACVALLALALSGLGILIAWPLKSTQGFHAIMNVALVPMWLLSGALFPATGASPWVRTLMRFNPLTPAVEILRAFLTNTPAANLALRRRQPGRICAAHAVDRHPAGEPPIPMSVTDLPALNATLNATSAVLLVTGYILIRRGNRARHKAVHDCGAGGVGAVPDVVRDLPPAGRLGAVPRHRLDQDGVLRGADPARDPGRGHRAARDHHGVARAVGAIRQASPHRAVDAAAVVVCVGDRRDRLSDALSDVERNPATSPAPLKGCPTWQDAF